MDLFKGSGGLFRDDCHDAVLVGLRGFGSHQQRVGSRMISFALLERGVLDYVDDRGRVNVYCIVYCGFVGVCVF